MLFEVWTISITLAIHIAHRPRRLICSRNPQPLYSAVLNFFVGTVRLEFKIEQRSNHFVYQSRFASYTGPCMFYHAHSVFN